MALGIGLAAACGLRVFLPLLAVGVAARTGHLALSDNFAWLASDPALIAFGTATVIEVLAYHVPFLDHLLDVLATPSAVVAGTVATAAVLTDVPPVVQWTLAVIAGGGTAGIVQSATVLTRVGSTFFTGGLGNLLLASFELFGALGTVVLVLVLPFVGLALVVLLLALAIYVLVRARRRRAAKPPRDDAPATA